MLDRKISAPTGEAELTPEFRNASLFPLVEVAGICTSHRLYADMDDATTVYYIVEPNSGSMEGLRRFYTTAHVYKTWNIKSPSDQFAASRWVMEQALAEVEAEDS